MRHLLFHLATLVLCITAAGQALHAQEREIDPEKAAAVKSHMLLNFAKYTQWPGSSFVSDDSPIIITVVGRSDLDESLTKAARNFTVEGRAIELRWVRYPAARQDETAPRPEDISAFYQRLRSAHIVYFAQSEQGQITMMLNQVESSNVLTVSDIPEFAERGGMLGFAIREGRVAFDANTEEIQETKLTVSSKVLKLARIVKTKGVDSR